MNNKQISQHVSDTSVTHYNTNPKPSTTTKHYERMIPLLGRTHVKHVIKDVTAQQK